MSGQSSAVRTRGRPAAGQEVFRLTTPVVLWWIWVAFAAANVIDLAAQGASAHSWLVIGAILLVITGFAYALALRPRVVADQSGITVVNPFRDHHVPWAVIQGVDTGDWVKVHRTKDDSAVTAIDVPGKAIECWALYVSARAKRRAAVPRPPPQRYGLFRPAGGRSEIGGSGPQSGDSSRMPAEAQYLASLPPAKAIASRLDTRAAKERARLKQANGAQAATAPATARWAWFPFAAIAVPALALLLVALLA